MKKIRVLVAEDHLIARVGVISIINAQPDMTVVAQAVNGEQAVRIWREKMPDVALLDRLAPCTWSQHADAGDVGGLKRRPRFATNFPAAG